MTTDVVPPFTFVVGCGRSGTTVLRTALDAHPELAVTHEAGFVFPLSRRRSTYEQPVFDVERLVADIVGGRRGKNLGNLGMDADDLRAALAGAPVTDYPDAVRRVFAAYATRQGKPRYGDKMPSYVLHLPQLAALFPEGRFVHIVRDGRDVVRSSLAFPNNRSSLPSLALSWGARVKVGRRAGRALGAARYLEVRYEELVTEPARVLADVLAFLDLPYDAAVLHSHERKLPDRLAVHPAHQRLAEPLSPSKRTWRETMSPREVELVEALVGDVLDELGYERAVPHPSPVMRTRALWARAAYQQERARARLPGVVRRAARTADPRTARPQTRRS
jgi:hypothetical protein